MVADATEDRSVGARLALGFGVVLALLVALAVLSMVRMRAVDSSLNMINGINSVKQRYAINFRGSVHDRSIALRDVVLQNAPTEVAKVVQRIDGLTKDYADSARPLDELFAREAVLPEEKSALARIKGSEARTMPLLQRVIALVGEITVASVEQAQGIEQVNKTDYADGHGDAAERPSRRAGQFGGRRFAGSGGDLVAAGQRIPAAGRGHARGRARGWRRTGWDVAA